MRSLALLSAFLPLCLGALYDQVSQLPTHTYDFVVVGAGNAGLVIASRLTENSKFSVLVLEAGISDKDQLTIEIPLLCPTLAGTEVDWNYTTEEAEAAVRPGSEEDLSKIMKVLANKNLLFGIKGGGHATRPKMSSTTGIQIDMCLFDDVRYDSKDKKVVVGAGCIWENVYDKVLRRGRNVVGGGLTDGVGVAGWLVGGGYSLKTNQYGLGIDNIEAFRVVLPDGDVVDVTEADATYALYISLKGGGNNFGIVTQFTLLTHEQAEKAYGGRLLIRNNCLDEFKEAIFKFIDKVNEPKAAIVAAFKYILEDQVKPNCKVLCFLDNSDLSTDLFSDFNDISERPENNLDGGGLREMPFTLLDAIFSTRFDAHYESNRDLDFTDLNALRRSLTTKARAPQKLGGADMSARGRFGCIMVTGFTSRLIDTISGEAKSAANEIRRNGGRMVLFEIWPFVSDAFKRCATDAAWPHWDDKTFGPLIAYFLWDDKAKDKFWVKTMEDALDRIYDVAIQEKCTTNHIPLYMNTCLERDADPDVVYRDNIGLLSAIRDYYDPEGIMDNTGGVKIPVLTGSESVSSRLLVTGTTKETRRNRRDGNREIGSRQK